MTTARENYGRRLASLPSMAARLELEATEGDRGEFAVLDALTEELILRALSGDRVIALAKRYDDETISLLGDVDDSVLKPTYDVVALERRGAWGIADRETINAGAVNFAWWLRQEPRWVSSVAGDERRKVALRGNHLAVFAWAALTPIFETLLIPHTLRSAQAGKADLESQVKQWAKTDTLIEATGLQLEDELAVFRPRSGWSRLRAADIQAARETLIAGWARNATPEMAARLRMWSQSQVIDRFYAKAKTRTPTARQALTKAHWRPLVAHFGGDWLALLRYLGEQPAENEQVITTLPEPKIYVGAEDRAREAALDAGVEEIEVERMLSSFFGGSHPTSPVDRRIAGLRRLWSAVDQQHAVQVRGGRCLWGLLDERDRPDEEPWPGYSQGLWRELLPADLNTEVRALWGTQATTKAPDRLITRLLPHAGAADAFGPALAFWHHISLAAFANTEALPNQTAALVDASNHDIYKPWLEAMSELGHPVDRAFFSELNEATRRLEDIQPTKRPDHTVDVGDGMSITFSVEISGGRRLKKRGFEGVRDVITHHRRAWAEQHLDDYLRARWQTDLRAAAEIYNRAVVAKGKSPTMRQTIKACQFAIDRWFGGDVGGLLAAIGQKGPSERPVYQRVMPQDVYGLRAVVERYLGAVEMPPYPSGAEPRSPEHKAWRAAKDHNSRIYYAAMGAYRYIEAWEILGREPEEMKQVPSLRGVVQLASGDTERGWALLRKATRSALAETPTEGFISPVTMKAIDDEFDEDESDEFDDEEDKVDQAAGYGGSGDEGSAPNGAAFSSIEEQASATAAPGRRGFFRRLMGG